METSHPTLKRYWSERPCRRGHVGWRRLRNKACVACEKMKQAEWIENNKERFLEMSRASYWRNREAKTKIRREYTKRKLASLVAYNRDWRRRNREQAAEHTRRWRDKNPHAMAARVRQRQAALMQRFPRWADRERIKQFYAEAKRLTAETGVLHHVDHIIPLQGDAVCGLHVETNLQVIPWMENLEKANKFDPLSQA